MQNYINMFRICIINLNILHRFTNLLLKFLNCSNFQDQSTYWVFPKMSADISENVGRHFSKRHFKYGWGCRGGEGLKTKYRTTFKTLLECLSSL